MFQKYTKKKINFKYKIHPQKEQKEDSSGYSMVNTIKSNLFAKYKFSDRIQNSKILVNILQVDKQILKL